MASFVMEKVDVYLISVIALRLAGRVLLAIKQLLNPLLPK
jgi:hypothetical protein